jgi:hypothetical protein
VRDLRRQLDEIVERVLNGDLVPYRGSVAAQLINTKIRLIELERKVRETDEIEERLARVERARAARRGGATGWRG